MASDVHIIFPLMPGRHKKYDYTEGAWNAISSLIRTGFPEDKVVVITTRNWVIDRLKKIGNIQSRIMREKPHGQKGWFYKPLAYSNALLDPFKDSLMVMSDVDVLFYKNPMKELLEQKEDIWVTRRERFLRPSRVKRMNTNHIDPDRKNFKALKGYMGPTRAYLFLHYALEELPKYGLYSGFVSIKPSVYTELIMAWRLMYDQIKRTPHLQGDQEILDFAIKYLKLSWSVRGLECVKEFHCDDKIVQYHKAKEMGITAYDADADADE